MTTMTKPQPFVKWAGGKRSLIDEIEKHFPAKFNHYFEPFLGGGAVFFAFSERIKKATLSDHNLKLMVTYKVIKEEPYKLIEKLKEHEYKHSKQYYYSIRKRNFLQLGKCIDLAAQLIYLNRTCYNGLYRVNNSGEFNVPMGNYKNPNITQEDSIIGCHEVLKKADIDLGDFQYIKPQKGDFVYFDPPYDPIVDDQSFTRYTERNFNQQDQIRLSKFIKKLDKSGIFIMLSNSRTTFIESLYPKRSFRHNIVYAPRLVNCKADKRGEVQELLITNY